MALIWLREDCRVTEKCRWIRSRHEARQFENVNYSFGSESTCMVSNLILPGLAIFARGVIIRHATHTGKWGYIKMCTRGKILTHRGAEGRHFGSCSRLRGRTPSSKMEMDFPLAFPLDQIHQPLALHLQKNMPCGIIHHVVSYHDISISFFSEICEISCSTVLSLMSVRIKP